MIQVLSRLITARCRPVVLLFLFAFGVFFVSVSVNDITAYNRSINPIKAWNDGSALLIQTANHFRLSLSLQKPVMTQGSWGGGWASCDLWPQFVGLLQIVRIWRGMNPCPVEEMVGYSGTASSFIQKCALLKWWCLFSIFIVYELHC